MKLWDPPYHENDLVAWQSCLVCVANQTLKNREVTDKDKHKDGCILFSYLCSPQSSAHEASGPITMRTVMKAQ